jgi:membrane protease YdiL (CAAX protease family)
MALLLKVSPTILAEVLTVVPQREPPPDTWPIVVAAALFVVGVMCDAYLIAKYLHARRGTASGLPLLKVGPKLWGLHELLLGAAAFVGLVLLTNSFYSTAAFFSHHTLEELAPLIIATELLLRLGILIGFVVFFHRRRVDIDTALGLRNIAPLRAIGWGAVFGFASLPPVGLLIAANDALCRALGLHPSDQPISELFVSTDSPLLLGLLVVFAVVVAPVFEEFMFRGFAYPAFKQRFGTGRGLAIVSLAFAVSHLHAPSFVPLFVLAIGLGLAYEWTGSLLAPITMHALFNSIMVLHLILFRTQT